MAESNDTSDAALLEKFKAFNDAKGFTSKSAKNLVTDTLLSTYKKFDLIQRTDSSVYIKLKDKKTGVMPLNKDNIDKFIMGLSEQIAMQKKTAKDSEVENIKSLICKCAGPVKHTTKISKTGGVAKMTDTSQYTGAHKERFDAEGKGKGKEGRENMHKNTGYVGQYKDAGTYDTKKK